jgi:signal transduction histidine kinase
VDRSQPSGAWATAWRARLGARVGFWRALLEVALAGTAYSVLSGLLGEVLGTPWREMLSYLIFALYVWAAWRLAPGHGHLLRRAARATAWVVLLGLCVSGLGFVCLYLLPVSHSFFGINLANVHLPLGQYLVAILLVVMGPFILARTLLDLWMAGRSRLRWRLVYTYLLVGVLTTLLSLPAQALYIALLSLFAAPPMTPPAGVAHQAAVALTPLLQNGAPAAQLGRTLQGMLDGSTRLPLPSSEIAADIPPPAIVGVHRLTLLGPDGHVLAAAGQGAALPGASLPADDAAAFAPLLAGLRNGGCNSARPANGYVADSAACAMLDARGAPLATILVQNEADSAAQFRADLDRIVTLVLINAENGLSITFVSVGGILLISVGLGYLLARRMTRRLEGLAVAAGDLAAGDLDRRVAVDSADEIGRLSADFNAMALRLQERERALRAERDRAERLLAANRRLVADVSHELRNPLATLRGYVEALEQEHGDHLPARDLAVIRGEMDRLTGLIEDLFTLARAEAQQLPLTVEAVDAGALVRRLADAVAPLARRDRQIEIVAALPPQLPFVCADRARLEQVVLNLLQNALRHTPPGGIIAVEGQAADGTVTLAVNDTGVGIPPDEVPLIFERFYRGDRSRARESGGAGLGLALVHELTEAMGGHITVESEPGRGSRFSVVLRQAAGEVLSV